ncbi:excisionase family DNA binding protein [Microbacterium terrae]|nr:helix-turn-helix domain-containing protein [Microbacterium terrae]MBP1078663.1 excisionase family DNA binding protein [Microbacterium terrae]GLJ98064.1 hypothetical protein GCM10017594_12610 [Microbacterium terrae]
MDCGTEGRKKRPRGGSPALSLVAPHIAGEIMKFVAVVEVSRRGELTVDEVGLVIDRLPGQDVSLIVSQRGYRTARIVVDAENIAAAATHALLAVQHGFGLGWDSVVSIDLMSEAEAKLREGSAAVPELVGAAEAARLLGRSPQAVRQMIEDGRLSAYRVGDRSFALVKSEVLAAAARRTDWKSHPGLLGVLEEKDISIDRVLPSPRIRINIENDGARRARTVARYEFTVLGRYEDPEGKIVSIAEGQQELTEFDFTRIGDWTSPD